MNGQLYISGILQNSQLGQKQGTRAKYRGADWDPSTFKIPLLPDDAMEIMTRASQGHTILPEQFPEGIAVWDEKSFARRVKDIWWAGPFLTVNQKIADVISQFDLGAGGLVPVPLFKADLETPWPEKHYYINFGGPKAALLPEESQNVEFWIEVPGTGEKKFKLAPYVQDGDVALSSEALCGADIWIDPALRSKLFLSSQLVEALQNASLNVDLDLLKCRIVGDAMVDQSSTAARKMM